MARAGGGGRRRTVLHIDLDCFYCQVEHKRLGIPLTVPLAVQQWDGLIAVNYAARARGVSKFSNIKDASAVCPEIRTVHVATYADGEDEPRYHAKPDRRTHKASLDQYRRESSKIFDIFKRRFRIVERASIDEAFMDVSAEVDAWLEQNPPVLAHPEDPDEGYALDWTDLGGVEQPRPTSDGTGGAVSAAAGPGAGLTGPWTIDDVRLHRAAQLAREARQLIWEQLQYTCSAGVAHNKTLAKLCSGRRKPNQQTVLPLGAVLDFMRDLPLNKIRFLGGKVGSNVEEMLNIKTAGDVWRFEEAELRQRCGETYGSWLYNICRGVDDDPVEIKGAVKSMMAAKSFAATRNTADVDRWLHILATELVTRVKDEREASGRWPKTLQIHYLVPRTESRSKSCPFPANTRGEDDLVAAVRRAIDHCFAPGGIPVPCVRLAIAATGLHDVAAPGHDIAHFFAKAAAAAAAAASSPVKAPADDGDADDDAKAPASAAMARATAFPSADSFYEPLPALPKIIEDGMTQERRRGTVLHYFAKAPAQGAKRARTDGDGAAPARGDAWECPSCHIYVPPDERLEHADYHLAVEMQRQWRD